jgi:Rod binding domain-containing protein
MAGTIDLGSSLGNSLNAMGDASNAQVQAALKVKSHAKAAAGDFEAMFLNSMFQQMTNGVDGDGPFGGSGALKVWRSLLTDQYARGFAKAGGIGIASHVYDTLLKQQGLSAS